MNTEQQTTQNKQHTYTQVNTDIHKSTQIYTRQHRYTQVNTDIHKSTQIYTRQHRYTQVENINTVQ
jgi:hypothetical protein